MLIDLLERAADGPLVGVGVAQEQGEIACQPLAQPLHPMGTRGLGLALLLGHLGHGLQIGDGLTRAVGNLHPVQVFVIEREDVIESTCVARALQEPEIRLVEAWQGETRPFDRTAGVGLVEPDDALGELQDELRPLDVELGGNEPEPAQVAAEKELQLAHDGFHVAVRDAASLDMGLQTETATERAAAHGLHGHRWRVGTVELRMSIEGDQLIDDLVRILALRRRRVNPRGLNW